MTKSIPNHQDRALIFSSCRDVGLQPDTIRLYKRLELASYTSSTGIVLELKTKQECGGVYCILGQQCSWGFWVIHHAPSPCATSRCELSAGGSRISVTRVRRMAVCPGWGVKGGWGPGSRGAADPWPLWEEVILSDSRAGIMNSIKRRAASKARQNKRQRGDSTRSLSAHEKLSCDFRVPVIIVKVHSAYSLVIMRMSGPKARA